MMYEILKMIVYVIIGGIVGGFSGIFVGVLLKKPITILLISAIGGSIFGFIAYKRKGMGKLYGEILV